MHELRRPDTLVWTHTIPLVTNRFLVWDFLKVSVLSPLIMWTLVALMGWFLEGEPVLLPWFVITGTGAALFVLLLLASLLLGNRIEITFALDEEGVAYETGRRGRTANRIVTVVGAFAGSATTTGAGLLATASESGGWSWDDVHRVSYHPGPHVVSLKNSWRVLLRLYCTEEEYAAVSAYVTEVHEAASRRRAAAEPHTTRYRTSASLLVSVLSLAAGVSSQAWYWTDSEIASRTILAGALLLATAGWLPALGRRLVAALGLAATPWHAIDLVMSALEPIESWSGGGALTMSLDTGLLALAAASTIALAATAVSLMASPVRRRDP